VPGELVFFAFLNINLTISFFTPHSVFLIRHSYASERAPVMETYKPVVGFFLPDSSSFALRTATIDF